MGMSSNPRLAVVLASVALAGCGKGAAQPAIVIDAGFVHAAALCREAEGELRGITQTKLRSPILAGLKPKLERAAAASAAVDDATMHKLREVTTTSGDRKALHVLLINLERNAASLVALRSELHGHPGGEASLGQFTRLLQADGGCRKNARFVGE
jgi:hypothetical protein